jgi:hypothetical protein
MIIWIKRRSRDSLNPGTREAMMALSMAWWQVQAKEE